MNLETLKELYVNELRDLYNAENQLIKALPKMAKAASLDELIEEGSELLKANGDDSVLDAGIIVAAQKVEHYEIAGYGAVRTFAQLLGKDKSAELLQETLDEESEANELLNKLAEDIVNPEALMEPELASASR